MRSVIEGENYDSLSEKEQVVINERIEAMQSTLNKELDTQVEGSRMYNLSRNCIYGTDANPRMARTSKMNMIMHGDGHGGVHHHDDLLAVDYFMWDEILPLAEKKSPVSPATPEVKKPVTVKDSKSLHDEIKEKLVAIGELLGFDSRSEVKIATGAVVDAVWEAKIGNMGKAIYVFEVQSKGSIDSLILNLKKAQSNAAVQAVVAVADEEQLAKIIQESAGVIDEKSLRTWDCEDVLAVYDALVRAHESINKLALVPESF